MRMLLMLLMIYAMVCLRRKKGGLTKEHNLSSFSLQQFEDFLDKQKQKKLGRQAN
jgi:methyl coenzyme M reductase subunit C-like uncharacterized protein (methanogenesis marker protein 7)